MVLCIKLAYQIELVPFEWLYHFTSCVFDLDSENLYCLLMMNQVGIFLGSISMFLIQNELQGRDLFGSYRSSESFLSLSQLSIAEYL